MSSKFFQVSALCFSALILAGVRPAFAQVEDDKTEGGWQFAASVYLWGASIGGETRSGTGISVELEDLLSHLEMVFMGSFEARKGKWSLFTDAIYLDLSGSETITVSIPIGPGIPVTTSGSVDLASSVVHLAGGNSGRPLHGQWHFHQSVISIKAVLVDHALFAEHVAVIAGKDDDGIIVKPLLLEGI